MKKLTKFFGFLVVLLASTLLFVHNTKADEITEGDVMVELMASLDKDNVGVPLVGGGQKPYGTEFTVDLSSQTGTFQFWIVNGVIREDLPENHSFIATTDFTALAVFSNDQNVHVYVDYNGKHLGTNYVDELDPEPIPTKKIGYDFDGYNTTVNGLVHVHRATYIYEETTGDVTITVNGETQLVKYNSVLTVTAPEGHAWFENDILISLDNTYSFSTLSDRTISSGPVETPDNLVTFKGLDGHRIGYTTYYTLIDSKHTIVEYGLELDGVLTRATNLHPVTNEFIISSPDSFYKVRAYMIIHDGEKYVTVYDREITKTMIRFDVTLPENTPEGEIYLASSLNGFNPADEKYKLNRVSTTYAYIDVFVAREADQETLEIEYKFTRGNWETADGTLTNNNDNNRVLIINSESLSQVNSVDKVVKWSDVDNFYVDFIVEVDTSNPGWEDSVFELGVNVINEWTPTLLIKDGNIARIEYKILVRNEDYIYYKIIKDGDWNTLNSQDREYQINIHYVGLMNTGVIKITLP